MNNQPPSVRGRGRTYIDDEIIDILRAAMKAKSMLQKDIAAAADMTQAQVSRRLNACGPPIPIDQLEAMCRALGLDVVTVLLEATEKAPGHPATQMTDARIRAVEADANAMAELIWNMDDHEFIDQALAMMISEAADKGVWHPRHVARFALGRVSDELAVVFPDRPSMENA